MYHVLSSTKTQAMMAGTAVLGFFSLNEGVNSLFLGLLRVLSSYIQSRRGQTKSSESFDLSKYEPKLSVLFDHHAASSG